MTDYINETLLVVTDDGREMEGRLLVFDKHMNLVLSDVVERRVVKQAKGEEVTLERKLGLVLLRGEHVVSVRAKEAKIADKIAKKKGAGHVAKIQ
jgi:small nuclear ribonucleoprotein B and B'